LLKYEAADGKRGLVSSVDISSKGALLRTHQELTANSNIKLNFNFLGLNNKIINIIARIIRVEKVDNCFKVGVQFENINPEDKEFLEEFFNYPRTKNG